MAREQPDSAVNEPPWAYKDNILLFHVNDSTDDQVLFQAACKRAGIPINWHVADSAAKGISYLQTLVRKSKEHDVHWPNLVLLDIIMPGGNGFEVLKFMRDTRELHDIPVIIFTGITDPTFKEEAKALGATWFVLKPQLFEKTVEIARAIYDFCCQGVPLETSLI